MVTNDSTPSRQVRSTTTPTGEESVTLVSQPSSLGELSISMLTESDRKLEAIQRAQVSSLMGADRNKEPQEKTPKRQSPASATRPKKYALELWVEIETSPGVYSTSDEDSYSVDFAIDTINHAYPGCTGMYLDMAGHMLAFYGKKTNPRAGLLHGQGVAASKAITNISTWMGYFTRWTVRCVSISEASEILVGCKRLEKENLRQAHWELQSWFSSMRLDATLSAAARPLQPQATPPSSQEDDVPRAYPVQHGLARSSPTLGIAAGSPVRRTSLSHCQSSDNDRVSTDTSISDKPLRRRHGSRRSQSSRSGSDSDETRTSGERRKKKDGFSSKIQIPKFGGKKGHPHDVADTFRQWAHCITYYCDYYEDFYLMPLVVSSLMGDASDVFDWILSLNPGNTQDLTTLLQMLREHYCGSLTFREQRNTIENLCQRPQEAAIDFLIRVSTSVSNLGKDWKDELTKKELQSPQYEVSLNGVQEEIRHVLVSEIAKNGGKLTHQQMYEAVKRYKTYVAHNKRLKGKGTSLSTSQQKATGHTLGYKPQFRKTMASAATIAES